jgi:serine/threonine-protein kinase
MAGIAGVAAWSFRPEPELPVTRFSVDLEGQLQAFSTISISPDGSRIVYSANQQLYSRRMDQQQGTAIPGTEGGNDAFFAPDGQSVVFSTQNQLKAVGFAGEAPRVIADLDIVGMVGSWDRDGRIIFGQGGDYPLMAVAAVGGVPETFAELADYRDFDYPDVLPGGDWVLYTAKKGDNDWSESDIVAQNIATGERKIVLERGHFARFIKSGHLLFAREGTLYAVAFDPERVETTGAIVPVVQNVATEETGGYAKYAVAENGTLIYAPGSSTNTGAFTIVQSDRDGKVTTLSTETRNYLRPRVSPDGSRIAVEVADANTGVNIWVMTLATGRAVQLTFEGSKNTDAVWTPDSAEILFLSSRDGTRAIYRKAADGAGQASRVLAGTEQLLPTDVLDGNVLVYEDEGVDGSLDIFTFDLDESGSAAVFLATPDDESGARISPDGHWMAYVSGLQADSRIFIRPYPDAAGGQRAVPEMGGHTPVWSPSGEEIFFLVAGGNNPGRLASVPIESTPTTVVPGVPRVLFGYLNSGFQSSDWPDSAAFDVRPDGGGIVAAYLSGLLTPVGATAERPRINVVLNWAAELERQVP